MNVGSAALQAVDVRRSFTGREILTGVDLAVREREFVCLVGRSGVGKTVLLRILAGLDGDFDGAVTASSSVGLVFQDARLLPWLSVGANVGLGLSADPVEVEAALGEVGLGGRSRAWPGELSAGQAQRVALARTLLRRPHVVLLDEPFSTLDAFTRAEMQALLHGVMRSRKAAALLVTHDLDEALALGDRVMVLREGRIPHEVVLGADDTEDDLAAARANLLRWLGADAAVGDLLPRTRRVRGEALVQRRLELRHERVSGVARQPVEEES